MRERRGYWKCIHGSLLDDPEFQRLSPEARHTLLTLRLCSQNNRACIFRCYDEVVMKQTGYKLNVYNEAVAELIHKEWIRCGQGIKWIVNGLRYDPAFDPTNEKHVTGIENDLMGLPKDPLIVEFCRYYKIPIPSGYHMDTLSNNKDKEEDKEKEEERRSVYVGAQTAQEVDQEFEQEFWPSWHPNRRQEKKKGKEQYFNARRKVSRETIKVGVETYKQHPDWSKQDGYFVKHAFRWLRDERWTDEPARRLPLSDAGAQTAAAAQAIVEEAERGEDRSGHEEVDG